MNRNQLYHIPGGTNVDRVHFPGEALWSIYKRFFEWKSHESVFSYLTQIQHRAGAILARQETLRDLTERSARSFFKHEIKMRSLSEEVSSKKMVKVWHEVKRWPGGYSYPEPLVYDHVALADCVTRFQSACRNVLGDISGATSPTFDLIRSHLTQFVDDSEVTQNWDHERKVLAASGQPFLWLIKQDAWTHEIHWVHPIGFLAQNEILRLTDFIRRGLKSWQKTMTIRIGDETLELQFSDVPDPLWVPVYEAERKPKRYLDFDLFANARSVIRDTAEIWDHMEIYQKSMGMYDKLNKDRLPVCLTTPSRRGTLDVRGFYPLHCGLSPSKYVTNSIKLDPKNPIALITGLNAAGKSSLLHALWVITDLHNWGFYVPAEYAEIPYFETVSHQLIIRENIPRWQSTFVAQADWARKTLEAHDEGWQNFLMLDESTSGTDSRSHKAAIIEIVKIVSGLIRKPTIIVTHSTEAAEEIQANPKDYPGVQLLHFKKWKWNSFRKLVPGFWPSEGTSVLKETGLTFEDFKKKRKKKKKK